MIFIPQRKPFSCEHCNTNYNTKNHLDAHIRDKHSDMVYRCCICLKRFAQKQSVNRHVRDLHNGIQALGAIRENTHSTESDGENSGFEVRRAKSSKSEESSHSEQEDGRYEERPSLDGHNDEEVEQDYGEGEKKKFFESGQSNDEEKTQFYKSVETEGLTGIDGETCSYQYEETIPDSYEKSSDEADEDIIYQDDECDMREEEVATQSPIIIYASEVSVQFQMEQNKLQSISEAKQLHVLSDVLIKPALAIRSSDTCPEKISEEVHIEDSGDSQMPSATISTSKYRSIATETIISYDEHNMRVCKIVGHIVIVVL